ncbi:flippase [Candidatus Parcubacteria bacterium]|nr:flippase [Candidatus Parcubacteria bacterium]
MSRAVVAKNFTIQIVSRAAAVLVGLVSVAILTRALGATGFGEYTIALTFLQLFGVIVDFGLTLTLVVMISEEGANHEKIIGNILGLRMVSGALIFSLAPLTVLTLPWSDSVKYAVIVGSLAYMLMGGASLLVGIFQRYQAMWRAGLAEVINRLGLLACIALFAFLDLGVVWMMAASVVANALWLIASIHLARPFVRVRLNVDTRMWREVWSRSWPIAVSIFFNLLYLKGDIIFLSFYRDQAEVGLYGVSYRVIDVLTAFPVMFMGILLPLVVHTWSNGHREEFALHVRRTFDLFMLAGIPVVIGTQAVADGLIRLLAGPGYEAAGDILRLLSVAVFGVFLGALFGHLIVALNKQKPMVWGYAGVAVLTLIGYFLFIPPYGMWGAAWMTLFSELLIALITFTVVYRVARVRPQWSVALKALFASLVMYALLRFFPSGSVLVDIVMGTIVYVLAMLALGGIKREEIRALFAARRAV